MSQELAIPERFGPAQATEWFKRWGSVARVPDLELVLRGGAFLRPTGIALLAAGIAERQGLGLRTSLHKESGAEDAYRYLQRIDFFRALGVTTVEGFARHDEKGRFVPLQRISDETVAAKLAEDSMNCLRKQLDLPTSHLRMARFVFEELGVNIVQHSEKAETGFGVLQSYPDGLEIAFADRGIGFLASLQKNPELEGRIQDEAEALQIALGKGMTGTDVPRRNMGWGLGILQDFSDRVGGDLWIASGGAILRRRTLAGIRTNSIQATASWQGSFVCLDAPLQS